MKREDAYTGAHVFVFGDRCYKGTIVSINGDEVEVQWDDGKCSNDTYNVSDVTLADPVADKKLGEEVQAKVDEATNAFEKAFEALREAQNLAQKDSSIGALVEDNLVSIRKLESTIDENGWSSSSLWC